MLDPALDQHAVPQLVEQHAQDTVRARLEHAGRQRDRLAVGVGVISSFRELRRVAQDETHRAA